MAGTITPPNRKLIERLVKTGRFNNYSEVVRYGLELVRREIEREDLSQYPKHVLSEIYREMSRDEKASEAGTPPHFGDQDHPLVRVLDRVDKSCGRFRFSIRRKQLSQRMVSCLLRACTP